MRNRILIIIVAVIVVAGASSGWIYNFIKNKNEQKLTEGQLLNATLLRQYGNDITINQLITTDKVYAATWKSKDGIEHLSWNIGGVWIEVYRTQDNTVPETTPTETPLPSE